MVSQTLGKEYDEKLEIYQQLGVLYYAIYNPWHWERDRHQAFEIYKLENSEYRQQIGEPYWMPEVGLGLGRAQQLVGGVEMEVLLWYDEEGQAYPLPEEEVRELRAQRNQAQQKAERLAEYLHSLGLDPDNLPNL